jgi:hypothetical protein
MSDLLNDIRSSPARRRYEAMFGPAPASRAAADYLPEEQKESMMAYLARQGGGALAGVGKTLDTPGAIFRGVLAGDPLSGLSWDDDRRVSGEELLTKYGLLNDKSNPWLASGAGLAAEIALDPFAMAKLPLQALTGAGRAAKAAGILDYASDAVTKSMGFDEALKAAQNTRTGRAAYKFLGDLLPAGKGINPENVKYRPLVGPRVARTKATLEETINAAPDPAKAKEEVLNYLRAKGVSEDGVASAYDSLKGQNLGGAFGLGYFNFVDPIIFNPKGAEPYLDALDALGQSARWSAPARALSRFADKRVDGEMAAKEQLFAMKRMDRVAKASADQEVKAAQNLLMVQSVPLSPAAKTLLGGDNLAGEEGRKFLRRMYEGAHTASDLRLRDAIGPQQVDALVQNWDSIRTDIANQAAARGMKTAKLVDQYGGRWSPRRALEADFGEYGSGAGRKTLNTRTLENEARQQYLSLPGVTTDIEEISLLPAVQQFIKEGPASKLSVDDVAVEIKKFIDAKHGPNAADPRVVPFKTFVPKLDASGNPVMETVLDEAGKPKMVAERTANGKVVIDKATGQPKMIEKTKKVISPDEVITMKQAQKIARFMMRKSPDVPDNIGMFSENPLKGQARAMVSQGVARENADFINDSLAEAAVKAGDGLDANSVAGTRWVPMDSALLRIANETGLQTRKGGKAVSKVVQERLQQKIAQLEGIADPSTVNLKNYALPEDVHDRLTRIKDFYNSPRAQEDVVTLFDQVTQLFKGFALAFPSTKVRDFYSNTFLVWTQVGNGFDVGIGMSAANKVLAGSLDQAAASLRQIPRYNVADAAELQRRVAEDVSRTGILRSLASNDLLTTNRSALMNQLVPGSSPMRAGDWARELIPDGSRSPMEMLSDQFQFRGMQLPGQSKKAFETRNAMLNASQKASDWTDSVARLGGMFALMRQGVSADEAAKRMMSALVDYGSMTMLERQTLRRIFPWYAFQSRIGKFVAQELAQNPGGGYAQTLRAFNTLQKSDEDTYIPEALRQQFAFRVPDAAKPYLGISPDSQATTFLKDIDVPGFDVGSLWGSAPTAYGTVQSTAYNLLQQTNPFIRSAAELATGIDTFSRRPLEQAVTPLDRIYKKVTGSETSMNPLLRQLINVLPGPQQRIISLAGGLMDDRLPLQQRIAKQAFNTLAGMKLQDVDPAWQLQDARRLLTQQLGEFMQDYTESYIPEKVIPQVPPELLPQYQLFRTLGRDLREARK